MNFIKRGGKKKKNGKRENAIYHVKGKNAAGLMIPRHSTGATTIELARKYAKQIDDFTTLEQLTKFRRNEPLVAVVEKVEMTFPMALEKYLKHIRPQTSPETRKLYERELKRQFAFLADLKDPATQKPTPVTLVSQLERDHLVELQDSWLDEVVVVTALGKRRVSKSFMLYCVGSGWLAKNYWNRRDIPIPDDEDYIATLPLDVDDKHENWDKIRASVVAFLKGELLIANSKDGKKDGQPFLNPTNPLVRNPEVFLALLELMYYTGLRRSDAILFDVRELEPTELGNFAYTIKQVKTKKPVTVFLEPWLAMKLKALPTLDPGMPFFQAGLHKTDTNYVNCYVARVLTALGETLGIADLRCHRFRDSFAVNFLNDGGSTDDLKLLLGHQKVETTERYYAPWVTSRKKALEKRLVKVRGQQEPTLKLAVVPPAA